MKTGYVYHPVFEKHDKQGHPENSQRLRVIMNELKESCLINELISVETRRALKEEILLCHSGEYYDKVERVCSENQITLLDADTYVNKFSFDAAAAASGSLLNLIDAVDENKIDSGFAIVRPPGHHALKNSGMGFCIFGNAAIAAKYLLEKKNYSRVAIIDFDVHHGNGTQDLVMNDERILFVSSHQFPFYPGTGAVGETGKGNVINIPLAIGTGDEGFSEVYSQAVMPALYRFKPGFIIVSAGYDAHWKDPLADLGVTLSGFIFLTKLLSKAAEKLCGGKIVFTLEGGYNLNILKTAVSNSIKVLLGRNDFVVNDGKPKFAEPTVMELINNLKRIHKLN